MTVRVGVIGTGMIGLDHIRRITEVVPGGTVTAVTDVDAARAEQAAAGRPGPPAVHPSGAALIADPRVDAVLVTSWAQTHAEHVLAAIDAGKPVFCEKPLATTEADGAAIMGAEMAAGRRLVQVGFMRRYDPAYRAMKATVGSGAIGAPLLMHCAHRNVSAPPYHFTTESMISDSAIHEIDMVRWMFGAEIVSVGILRPRRSRKGSDTLSDPLIVLLELANGILADVEVFMNAGYGYDIRGEVVGESGTAALTDGGRAGPVPMDWRERFAAAFDAEFGEWLAAVAAGPPQGPTAWDGYAATAVAEACLGALRTGQRAEVHLPPRPAFYATGT